MVDHVHEIVTQRSDRKAPPGLPNITSHYFTCTCGYNGPPRRLHRYAIDDREAHLKAIKEAGGGSVAASDSLNSDGIGPGNRPASEGSNSQVLGVQGADLSRSH